MDRRLDRHAARAARGGDRGQGSDRDHRLHAERRLHRRRLRGRGRRGPHLDRGGDGHRRQERAQRSPRRDQGRAAREPRRHRRRAGHVRRSRQGSERRVPLAAEAGRAGPHRQRRRAHRRSWRHRHPAALGRGRHHQHGARLRSLPAGRDPGAVGHHARHAPHGADRRHARPRGPQALHAPLQLRSVLHGRDGTRRLAEASGDRSRRARRAGARAGGAVQGGVALHAARRERRAVVERLDLDGVGLRLDACR